MKFSPRPAPVALETTLPAHGVPRAQALPLARQLDEIIASRGAVPTTIGVLDGEPVIGMTPDQLASFLARTDIEKTNSANLGAMLRLKRTAATTVSATIELAHGAGIRVMATGGIGGVHRGSGFDISSDLIALTRFPVAVVCSGCKTILDVNGTREALETLGVPVVGFKTDVFPAFYLTASDSAVDARFDDVQSLAEFIAFELERTGRGLVVAQPIPEADAIHPDDWRRWLAEAERRLLNEAISGRDVTPRLLAALHDLSGGATLRANMALVKANARLGADLAIAMREARVAESS